MGFLRRLFGCNASVEQGMTLNVNYFTRTRDDASVEVVGEAYRQDLIALARSPGASDLPRAPGNEVMTPATGMARVPSYLSP